MAPLGQLSAFNVAPLIAKLGVATVALALELLLDGFGSGALLQTVAALV